MISSSGRGLQGSPDSTKADTDQNLQGQQHRYRQKQAGHTFGQEGFESAQVGFQIGYWGPNSMAVFGLILPEMDDHRKTNDSGVA